MPAKDFSYSSENCYIDERGFLYFNYLTQGNCDTLTIDKLNNYIMGVTKICHNNYLPFLIDLRDVKGVATTSTLTLLAKDIQLKSICSKIVFIVNSLAIKILMVNYIKIYKPKIPSIVIADIDEGINFCMNPE